MEAFVSLQNFAQDTQHPPEFHLDDIEKSPVCYAVFYELWKDEVVIAQ